MTSRTEPDDAPSSMAGEHAARQFLRIGLRGESFAVPIDDVREILEVGKLTVLPCTPDFVRGVLNVRGSVVPIIDIGARFGRGPSDIGRRSCIVVVEVRSAEDERPHTIGMLVDAVHEVFGLAADGLDPVPRLGMSVPPDSLAGIARVRSEVVPVFDVASALAPNALAELIAQAIA